ncbi:hypothetical protein E2C01_018767 [Portunus trituberculatus]|uniref:Secreted protein n=1 Tax=Portunus trituberculatus TaxID=210409 RepID=A0A5B7DWJ9_PORTR|nr:hypothetical protein [Portunus trituberculatus]
MGWCTATLLSFVHLILTYTMIYARASHPGARLTSVYISSMVRRMNGGRDEKESKSNPGCLSATYFFLPKKHMAMLFQSGGDSGMDCAATLYLGE